MADRLDMNDPERMVLGRVYAGLVAHWLKFDDEEDLARSWFHKLGEAMGWTEKAIEVRP